MLRVVLSRRPWSGGLWTHADFLRLWSAEAISQFGTQITLLALPLTAARPHVLAEIAAGLRVVFGQPALRDLTLYVGTALVFDASVFSVLVLYLTRDVGIEPGLLGLVWALSGTGFLVGAVAAQSLTRRFGLGGTFTLVHAVCAASMFLPPLMGGLPPLAAAGLLLVGRFLYSAGESAFVVNELSLRQAITPPALRCRVNATIRVLTLGLMPVGSLMGGILGEAIGLRPAMLLAAVGDTLAFGWLLWSPVRRLRDAPAALAELEGAEDGV